MHHSRRRIRKAVPTLRKLWIAICLKSHPPEGACGGALDSAYMDQHQAGAPAGRRIRASDLAELRDDWLKARAPATVVRRMALLSHVYTIVRGLGFDWLANPVQLVRRPAVNDARDRRLYANQLRGISEGNARAKNSIGSSAPRVQIFTQPAARHIEECPREELDWIIRATRSNELPTILVVARDWHAQVRGGWYLPREFGLDAWGGSSSHTKNGRARDVPLTPLAREALRRWVTGRPMRGRIFTMMAGQTRAFIRARRRARSSEMLCRKHGRRPNPAYLQTCFHDLRHEGTRSWPPSFRSMSLPR